MFKYSLSLLLSFSLVFTPVVASASLGEAFSGLMSGAAAQGETPEVLRSRARTNIALGSLEVRFPSAPTPQLFSATGPAFSVGCNGVSAHFGGFSFISGKNIERFIQNIMQGAPGYILSTVIKVLCPQCEAVLQVMQRLAQTASMHAIDSCKLSQKLAAEIVDGMSVSPGEKKSNKRSLCGTAVVDQGGAVDFLGALESVCEVATEASKRVRDAFNQKKEGKTEAEKEALDLAEGNTNETTNSTWAVLKGLNFDPTNMQDYRTMLLFMNLVGTQAWDSQEAYNEAELRKDIPPVFRTPAALLDLSMCGIHTQMSAKAQKVFNESPMAKSHCEALWSKTGVNAAASNQVVMNFFAQARVFACSEPINCHVVTPVTLEESDIFSGEGFIVEVHSILMDAVNRVATDQPLDDTHMRLLTSSPIPMYQAVNAAAVYPSQAGTIVSNLSLFYAQLMAHGLVDRFLTNFNRLGGKPLGDHEKVFRDARAVVANFNVAQRALLRDLVESWKGTQFISEQIRLLNLSIQKEVLTSEMANSNALATAIKRNTVDSENGNP